MSSKTPSKVVFVGNIPYGLSEEQISDIFSGAGQVLNFRLVYDRETGRPKGFGFAEYPDPDSAASAVRNLNDYEIMGRKLRVDFSNEGGSGGEDGNNNSSSAYTQSKQNGDQGAQSAILPPLPPGRDIPPGATATDEISRILQTLPPSQLLDFLQQMKDLAISNPARATELLHQAPQLAYAVAQALLLMELVSPDTINACLESGPPAQGPGSATAPTAPPAAAAHSHPGVAATNTPPVGSASAYAPPPAAAAPAADPGQDALIQGILNLSEEQINSLGQAERDQIMALRAMYGR